MITSKDGGNIYPEFPPFLCDCVIIIFEALKSSGHPLLHLLYSIMQEIATAREENLLKGNMSFDSSKEFRKRWIDFII